MSAFEERTELERGFAKVFDDRLRDRLTELESDRAAIHRRALLRTWAVLLATLVAVVLLWTLPDDPAIGLPILIALFGFLAALITYHLHGGDWQASVAGVVMPAVCDHLPDIEYLGHRVGGFPAEDFSELGVVGDFSSSTLRNRVAGTHHGTRFDLVQADLVSRAGGKSHTVFAGALFHIDVPVKAPGPILITRDLGAIGNAVSGLFAKGRGRGMPRARMPHADFEAEFVVHAELPQSAVEFLPGPFLDTLLDIARHEGGKDGPSAMSAGFRDRHFYLAIERDQMFAAPSLDTGIERIDRYIHAVFADFEMVYRVIDRLHGITIPVPPPPEAPPAPPRISGAGI